MKVFNKLNKKLSNLNKFIQFNKLVNNHFSSSSQNISSKSHLQQISERDNELAEKVILDSNKYTVTDFSNFLRVTLKTKNPKYLEVFLKETPKHISQLNAMDVRKVISIVIANPKLEFENNLIEMIRLRNLELNHENDTNIIRNFTDLSFLPYSVRFWVYYARTREIMYSIVRNWGLSLK